MYISYNKYQVYGKAVILFFLLTIIGLFTFFHPPLLQFHLSVQVLFLILLALLIVYFIILMTLQLLLFPKGIEIDYIEKTLTVHYFLFRSTIIYSTDILEYATTLLVTKSTNYEGILVLLTSGRKYLFADINLSDYKPVKLFLDDCNINISKDEEFSNIAYFISFFKFK